MRSITALIKKGPVGALRSIVWNLRVLLSRYFDRRYDRRFKVQTRGMVRLEDLQVASGDKESSFDFTPTPARSFKFILGLLPEDLSGFTFVDFGAGKGRTLLLASDFDFKKVIGVEFSAELHRLAQTNISSYRSRNQKCFDIESVCINATSFSVPEECCVFYFYCPFHVEILAKVLDNIESSYTAQPRKMFVLYTDDRHSSCSFPTEIFESREFLRRIDSERLPSEIDPRCPLKLAMYETPEA